MSDSDVAAASEKPASAWLTSHERRIPAPGPTCRQLHRGPLFCSLLSLSLPGLATLPRFLRPEPPSSLPEGDDASTGRTELPHINVPNPSRVLHLANAGAPLTDSAGVVFTASPVWVPLRLSGISVLGENTGPHPLSPGTWDLIRQTQ